MGDVIALRKDRSILLSGGELPHGSSSVWAIDLGANPGKKAHFWLRARRGYLRMCDGREVPAFIYNGQCSLFGPGNYPKCKNCLKFG